LKEGRWLLGILLEHLTKTATLLGVLRATVSKVMSAYTNHGKTTSVKKINIDRKRSSYTEDSFENSHNYCSTGDSRTTYSS
jgi:Zn/Cd-binding protein ZinT